MSKKIRERFLADTLEKADADRCPFLRKTLLRQIDAILKKPPEDLERVEDYLRTWRCKVYYAFFMVMYPGFSRKKFAAICDIAYGTARNWKNDKKVVSVATELACEFVAAYINEVKRLLDLPRGNESLAEHLKQRNTALHKLFAEAAFYKNEFVFRHLLKAMGQFYEEKKVILEEELQQEEAFLKGKIKELKEIEGFGFALLVVRAIESFFHILKVFAGSYENPEELDAHYERIEDEWKSYFLCLNLAISTGKTKNALDCVEVLEQEVKQLLRGSLFLEKELLNVKHKHGKKGRKEKSIG